VGKLNKICLAVEGGLKESYANLELQNPLPSTMSKRKYVTQIEEGVRER
jgi:hypothetical protein